MSKQAYELTGLEIAVIGMAVRLPGADNLQAYWQNLIEGRNCITTFTDEQLLAAGISESSLSDPAYVKCKGIVEQGMGFEPAFFDYNHREADIMDPQLRVYHETVYQALTHAGYMPQYYDGAIGLYGGAGANPLWSARFLANNTANAAGQYQVDNLNSQEYFNTRVAHSLNLTGPAMTVQTACSSSLVCVHLAGQALIAGDCDIAVAGGVEMCTSTLLKQPEVFGYFYQQGMIVSPKGDCRPFDAEGQGTIFSDGAGCVVLKRLEDAIDDGDTIYGIVKGTAINNDGNNKVGFTAPGVDGQAQVITAALEMAEAEPESISYIEAHGTGTSLGDPIEIKALNRAFDGAETGSCLIGSVKGNIGHLGAAAGIAGMIKTLLAMNHQQLPPCAHFNKANPALELEQTPFNINGQAVAWQDEHRPLRAGISSFGIGGTNAHVIVEEYVQAPQQSTENETIDQQILLLSATTQSGIENQAQALMQHLKDNPATNFADAAYTLQVGRKHQPLRRAIVAKNADEAVAALADASHSANLQGQSFEGKVVFMFAGQGSQYPAMGAQLYQQNATFAHELERCFDCLAPASAELLKAILFDPTDHRIDQTSYTQPLLFMIEYALAKTLMSYGVEPWAMAGHSIGEYVAATLAGVFELSDAINLVMLRGRLMASTAPGAMTAVSVSAQTIKPLLQGSLGIAAINTPQSAVVSGALADIEAFEQRCQAQDIQATRLRTSHGYHSELMRPVLAEFAAQLDKLTLNPPQKPYLSNLSGTWITEAQATSTDYWCDHLVGCVQFADNLATLYSQPGLVLVEVGPGRTLSGFAKRHDNPPAKLQTVNLLAHHNESFDDAIAFNKGLAKLHIFGQFIDWRELHGHREARRIALPGYQFERTLFIPEPVSANANTESLQTLEAAGYHTQWRRQALSKGAALEPQRNWLVFGAADDGISADLSAKLGDKLSATGAQVVRVNLGAQFAAVGDDFQVNRANELDFVSLLNELVKREQLPDEVVVCWDVPTGAADSQSLNNSFYGLSFLAKAFGSLGIKQAMRWSVLSVGVHSVNGDEAIEPAKALLMGAVRVITQEYQAIDCRNIDFANRPKVDTVLSALATVDDEQVVAIRGHYRWLRHFERGEPLANRALSDVQLSSLNPEGHVLITGGLGGIGLTLANALADKASVKKLTLLSRKGLIERSLWQNWLDAHHQDNPVSQQITAIEGLEQRGVAVHIAKADVADYEALSQALAEAKAELGDFSALIHGAGLPGGGALQLKSTEQMQRVMAAKVTGSDNLAQYFAGQPLDFVALCSSITAIVGGFGQADYCAANAYLDAMAQSDQFANAKRVFAINYDPWKETGMAVNAHKAGDLAALESVHPLLGAQLAKTAEKVSYKARFEPGMQWVLDEHKVMNIATVPGTAYLEMARSAYCHCFNKDSVSLSDVYFMAPLALDEGQWSEVTTELSGDIDSGENIEFTIASRLYGNGNKVVHAKGKLNSAGANLPPSIDLESLWRKMTPRSIVDLKQSQDAQASSSDSANSVRLKALDCGPRWDVFKQVGTLSQGGEAIEQGLAQLSLSEAFAAEVDSYLLHPSLLDCAAAFLRPFIAADFYFPLYYRKLSQLRPLAPDCYAHAKRLAGDDDNMLTFDVNLYDSQGRVCVVIEGFAMRRMTEQSAPQAQDAPVQKPQQAELQGLTNEQGVNAFMQLLGGFEPAMVATTVAFDKAVVAGRKLKLAQAPNKPSKLATRPEMINAYVAPRTETEKKLANLWQSQLGIEQVGIIDEFFELGGDSLLLMQVHANLGEVTDVSVPIADLYNFPTIKALAASIDKAKSGGKDEKMVQAQSRAEQMKQAMQSRRRRR